MIIIDNDEIIFLLGAGASVDAGMPTLYKLTNDLKNSLTSLSDVNGIRRPEFRKLFSLIENYDSSISNNYEHFFEWINILSVVNKDPYKRIIHSDIPQSLVDLLGDISQALASEVARILYSYRRKETNDLSYLSNLGNFLPKVGRLKVFSLNYDCCIEDACMIAGIDIATGFDLVTKRWNQNNFSSRKRGINLYKLHGSICWYLSRDSSFPRKLSLIEVMSQREYDHFSSDQNFFATPELILGPGGKLQNDDPYLTLYYQFRRAISEAEMLIIIGYGYNDPHVTSLIDEAVDRCIPILDINLKNVTGRYFDVANYNNIQKSAKDALCDGSIEKWILKMRKAIHDSKQKNRLKI